MASVRRKGSLVVRFWTAGPEVSFYVLLENGEWLNDVKLSAVALGCEEGRGWLGTLWFFPYEIRNG